MRGIESIFLNKYLIAQLNAKPDSRVSLRILADSILLTQKAGDERKIGQSRGKVSTFVRWIWLERSAYARAPARMERHIDVEIEN